MDEERLNYYILFANYTQGMKLQRNNILRFAGGKSPDFLRAFKFNVIARDMNRYGLFASAGKDNRIIARPL